MEDPNSDATDPSLYTADTNLGAADSDSQPNLDSTYSDSDSADPNTDTPDQNTDTVRSNLNTADLHLDTADWNMDAALPHFDEASASEFLTFRLIHASQPSVVEKRAQEFLDVYADQPELMNIVITNLILNICFDPKGCPGRIVSTSDLNEIKVIIAELFQREDRDQTQESVIRLKGFLNLVRFLKYVASSSWRNVSIEYRFDSYFTKLMMLLGKSEELSLRQLSVLVRLTFVDDLLDQLDNISTNQLDTVRKYATYLLNSAYHDSNRDVWISCLQNLAKWLRRGPPFLADEFLRYVIYSLKDTTADVIRWALQISRDLLGDESCRPYLKSFAVMLYKSLAVVKSWHPKDFQLVCRCGKSLYRYCEWLNNSLPIDFYVLLWSHIFDKNRRRAKIAAKVFRKVVLCNEFDGDNVVKIIEFLEDKHILYRQLFVDAFIDDYELITDWNLLAKMLKDDISLLSDAQKHTLMTVVLTTVEQLVNRRSPEFRMTSLKYAYTPQLHQREWHQKLTRAFIPVVTCKIRPPRASNTNESKPALASRSLVYYFSILSYFKFDEVPTELLESAIVSCQLTLLNVDLDLVETKIFCRLLVEILGRCSRPDIQKLCKNVVKELKTYYERQCELSFVRRMSATLVPLKRIFTVLSVLSTVLPLDERLDFISLLENLGNDADAALCKEMLVMLLVNQTKMEFKRYKKMLIDKDTLRKFSSDHKILTKICQVYDDGRKMVLVLSDLMNDHFGTRFGRILYHGICECLLQLSGMGEDTISDFLSDKLGRRIATFVATVIRDIVKTDADASEKVSVVKVTIELIESDILPVSYASDILLAYCKGYRMLEDLFRAFLLKMGRANGAEKVAKWLLNFLIAHSEAAKTVEEFNCVVALTTKINRLLYPVRKELATLIRRLHLTAIEYATCEHNRSRRVLFLYALAELSVCLDKTGKRAAVAYLKAKAVSDPHIMETYLESLSRNYVRRLEDSDDEPEGISDVAQNITEN